MINIVAEGDVVLTNNWEELGNQKSSLQLFLIIDTYEVVSSLDDI